MRDVIRRMYDPFTNTIRASTLEVVLFSGDDVCTMRPTSDLQVQTRPRVRLMFDVFAWFRITHCFFRSWAAPSSWRSKSRG
jgi:ketosteroid isomerase-like protein